MKLICSLIILFISSNISADGIPFINNRYAGSSKISILNLTDIQIRKMSQPYEYYSSIELTKQQQLILLNEAKLKVSPTKLDITIAEKIKNECSCGSANIGFLFNENQIEVPHEYLFSDKEAIKIRNFE